MSYKPATTIGENGTESTSQSIFNWLNAAGANWYYVTLGKPTLNTSIESFNERLLDIKLNKEAFNSLTDARRKLALWLYDNNTASRTRH